MDLFQSMKAFVTTVNLGSMSAAAQYLKLTPAMVGQHIAALESRLGTRLLNRTTRRQNLTDFGSTYYEQCKDIIERVALSDMEAEAQSSEAMGTLRITAPMTFGSSLLVQALTKYRELSPLVKVDLALTDRNVDIVEEGIDVAFRIGDVPDSRIIQRTLMPYKIILCASGDYLVNHGTPQHPSDLSGYEIVSFTSASRVPLTLFKDDETVTVEPKCMITVNNGHGLLNAAKSGLGIVAQPEMLLKPDVQSGALVQLLPDWQIRSRQVSLLYYRDQNMTPRLRSFINFAVAEFYEVRRD